MEAEKKCSCDQAKIEEFKQEIKRLEERDAEARKASDVVLDPVRKSSRERAEACSDFKEMRRIRREGREEVARLTKEHGLTVPPAMGRFYPEGPRYWDSFGFRCRVPGECEDCYETYCENARRSLEGMFD